MRFELTVRIDSVRRFSKPLPSATRPPLRRERKPNPGKTPDTAFARPSLGNRRPGVKQEPAYDSATSNPRFVPGRAMHRAYHAFT